MDDASEPLPPDVDHYRPKDGGKFYINKEEDFSVSDISQGMTTAIGMAVDDQVYGLGEVRVIGLDNLLGSRVDGLNGHGNAHTDDDIIDPDEEGDVVLQLHDMRPSPNLSRNTSLSSLTNDFYKTRDSGKVAISERRNRLTTRPTDDELSFDEEYSYSRNEFHRVRDSSGGVVLSERWNQLNTRPNDDELSFDEKYTYSHVHSDVSSFPKENIDMGWPSLSSTRTPIEGKFQTSLAIQSQARNVEYITSMEHMNDLTLGPNRLYDVGSHTQNTFSDKSTGRSIVFGTYVYNRVSQYSRKKKACIVISTAFFLVLVSFAFVMGFRRSHIDMPNTSNSISGNDTFEIHQLTKRENSSSESIADTDADVLLASVLSDHNDSEHESTLPIQTAGSTPETESKADDEKVIHTLDNIKEKNQDTLLTLSPTTAPMASVKYEGLFDFDADLPSSPVVFVSPAPSATLQFTTNQLTHSSESPAKKATTSPTQ